MFTTTTTPTVTVRALAILEAEGPRACAEFIASFGVFAEIVRRSVEAALTAEEGAA
jgi:hypothetical protein